jgi:hypothetical protein
MRVCGKPCGITLKPAGKVETAYYMAVRAIQQILDLLAA